MAVENDVPKSGVTKTCLQLGGYPVTTTGLEAAIESGMKTLKDDAIAKILLGQTTLEECLRVIYAG